MQRAHGLDRPQIHYRPMPDHLKGRYQYFTQADMTRLRAAGYTQEFITLEAGCLHYVGNFLEKPDRYR